MASDPEVVVAAAMKKLSVDDTNEGKVPGTNAWCLENWGCSLPLAFDLASEFFRDKFAEGGQHDRSAIAARLAALNLQICQGSSTAASNTSPSPPHQLSSSGSGQQQLADDVLSIWQTLGDMPRDAAMVEFIGTLNATAEPAALKSHVVVRLGSGDRNQTRAATPQQFGLAAAPAAVMPVHGDLTAAETGAEQTTAGDIGQIAGSAPSVIDDVQPETAIEEGALWTVKEIKEFKEAVKKESKLSNHASSIVKVGSGETLTVRVPTHKNGNSLMWEFATDSYDIAFGIYFEWNDSPPDDVQVVLSDSSDEDEDAEFDGATTAGATAAGGDGSTDPEKGSEKGGYGPPVDEIIPIFRRNCHEEVHCGSHVFPGSGIYLLKFDNSYSLWRSKTLYYRVYCA